LPCRLRQGLIFAARYYKMKPRILRDADRLPHGFGCPVHKEGCGIRRIIAILLCALMLAGLCACGSSEGGYRILETYEAEGSYVIAFRKDDALRELITAVMQELAENGTLRTASLNWFREDLVSLHGQRGAMDELRDSVQPRTLIVGVITDNKPLSFETGAGYSGFDVDVANYICGYLGWSMVIRPIGADEIGVQLASGNIDCAMGVPESEMSTGSMKQLCSFSPEYLLGKYVLVARIGGVKNRLGLSGKTLGVLTADIDIFKSNEKFVEKLGNVIYQTGSESLFAALDSGAVDAILVSSPVAQYYMQ